MTVRVARASWPASRLGEALALLARTSGLVSAGGGDVGPPVPGRQGLGTWLRTAGARLGVEVEAIEARYEELGALVTAGGPMVLRIGVGDDARFLVVVRGGARRVRVLHPERGACSLPAVAVQNALSACLEAGPRARVDALLEEVGVARRRRERARRALLAEHLAGTRVQAGWLVRPAAATPLLGQLRQARQIRRLAAFVAAHTAHSLLFLASWWVIGRGALEGRVEPGWLVAWTLLLVTMVPLQLAAVWLQGRFFVAAGALLKRRLLAGVLRTDPEELRTQGAGQLLGRVVESEAVETLVLGGGAAALLSMIELGLAVVVLALGAGGPWHAGLLVAWTVLSAALVWRVYRARDRWTDARLDLTHDLVERMVGHRTRLAQEVAECRHQGEDELLTEYATRSLSLDDLGPLLAAAPPAWQVVGVLGLAAPFVTGSASAGALAVGLGGVILADRALTRFVEGLASLAGAAIAWQRVAPIYSAATETGPPGTSEGQGDADGGVLLAVRDLVFRYPHRPRAVLDGVDLDIAAGDRLLLVGPSGGGKSTLAALLAAVRRPRSGLVLLGGLDLETVGQARWHGAVAVAPQFHENHVLTETFLFNLLMGREWPPEAEDAAEAEAVCRELGLGDLLERMPSGLLQMVGDTGWQLSHGEQSRLFVARALLQRSNLVILDESFGALDPENLRLAFDCADRRAATLLVVAHP